MGKYFEALKPYIEKQMALQTALTILDWDNATLAPEAASEKTAKMIGVLSEQYREVLVDTEGKKILKKAAEETDLSESQRAIVDKMTEELRLMEAVPQREYREFSELQGKSVAIWTKAKESNDFECFAPVLKQIIEYKRKFAKYQAKEGQNPYDALLEQFEKDFGMVDLDRFFGKLKEAIDPLLKEINHLAESVDKSFLFQNYPVKKQKKFNKYLCKYLGFEFKKGALGESAHPFTTNLHNEDVRITTHYYKNNIESAVFSTIHEVGHALYELGIPDKLTQTPVGCGASCGMHESQSRFLENVIGRSRQFWEPLYGTLQEIFPEQLGEVDLEQFILAVNKPEPSLIRTEADELTYCLHIMVRYEVEKKIFEEDYPVEKLPELWNSLYKQYLGVEPKNAAEGILQDVHWAMGEFGYFPSYALGNAFAAQIYHQMKKDLDVDSLLKNKKINKIIQYLRKNIHQYGAVRTPRNMLKDLTGEEFNADYYIAYLNEKYKKLYEE